MPGSSRRRRGCAAALCAFAVFGASAAPAHATTFTQTALGFTGMWAPRGVAIDSSGNVLVTATVWPATSAYGGVLRLDPTGEQQRVEFGRYLNNPTDVASDGSGNLFVAETGSHRILRLAPDGTLTTLVSTALNSPRGVAVDSSGDVFATSRDDGRGLWRLTPSGTQTAVAYPYDPYGVDVDASGNAYVTDWAYNPAYGRVIRVSPEGTQTHLPFAELQAPSGVAVDSSGNVFVASAIDNKVVVLTPGRKMVTLPFTGLRNPDGVAVDAHGSVLVADTGNNRIVKLTPSASSGSLAISPGSGPAGSSIAVSSVSPCPDADRDGYLASATARFTLYSAAGVEQNATGTASFDEAGNWAATLDIPADAADGHYFVRAHCETSDGLATLRYAAAAFAVSGATQDAAFQGRAARRESVLTPVAPAPAGAEPQRLSYRYTTRIAAPDARVVTTAKVGGRKRVVGRGRILNRRLRLELGRLPRGRYRLTLLATGARGKRVVVGHATLVVS